MQIWVLSKIEFDKKMGQWDTNFSPKNSALLKFLPSDVLILLLNLKIFFFLFKFGGLNDAKFEFFVVINRVISLST